MSAEAGRTPSPDEERVFDELVASGQEQSGRTPSPVCGHPFCANNPHRQAHNGPDDWTCFTCQAGAEATTPAITPEIGARRFESDSPVSAQPPASGRGNSCPACMGAMPAEQMGLPLQAAHRLHQEDDGMTYTLRLDAESLGSKFGFNDGDMPDSLLDEYDRRGLSYPEDWDLILVRLVRKHLLPALPNPVEVHEIGTAHNPIRAADPDDVDGLDVAVDVTWDDIQTAIAEARHA